MGARKLNGKPAGAKPKAKRLDLRSLGNGCPALTPSLGTTLCESAAVCLGGTHAPGAKLDVRGTVKGSYVLDWPPPSDQMRRAYNDPEEATEQGACGVAILVLRDQTGLTLVERSRKGTGFDYWLGADDDVLFQKKARLEVSGVRKGKPSDVAARVRQKVEQTKRSDALGLKAFVVVVEFGTPVVVYEERA